MGAAAAQVADLVVVTDDNPRVRGPRRDPRRGPRRASSRCAPRGATSTSLVVGDRREAIREAVRAAWPEGPDATVAVVGKGHETGQEVGGVVHPFDDRHELAEALRDVAGEGAA